MHRANVYVLCKLFEARCDVAMPKYLFWETPAELSGRRSAACMLAQRLPSVLPSVLPLSPHIDKKCT